MPYQSNMTAKEQNQEQVQCKKQMEHLLNHHGYFLIRRIKEKKNFREKSSEMGDRAVRCTVLPSYVKAGDSLSGFKTFQCGSDKRGKIKTH